MIEIKIKDISPHPKNPRKDLGDLTELTDSIRTFGVLQNLTVVPDGTDKYVCLFGHRRLAAAKKAGLKTLPCVIAEDMDEKTQVSIMLLENMQRSDLTVQEEAQGMQMMLDLGDTKDEIAEKTGFSKATIDRRLKLKKLDRQKLIEADKRGGTLFDYMELYKIEDPEARNELLESIGTQNFKNDLEKALNKQEMLNRFDRIVYRF